MTQGKVKVYVLCLVLLLFLPKVAGADARSSSADPTKELHSLYRGGMIILVGKPASGKGTLAKRIMELLGVKAFSMSKALGEIREAAEAMEKGLLVGDDLVNRAMAKDLRRRIESGEGFNFILDGAPRSPAQAEFLLDLVTKLGIPLEIVVNLQISDDVARERSKGRRESFIAEGKQPRSGDQPEKFDLRLKEFYIKTEPAMHIMADGVGPLYITVNGHQAPDKVFLEFVDKGVEVLRSRSSAGRDGK